MDTTSAVTDGDGLIFHYRAGLYTRYIRVKERKTRNDNNFLQLRTGLLVANHGLFDANTIRYKSQHYHSAKY